MATEICEGQQYDVDFESQEHVAIDDYLLMIRLKTSVLLATALQMGAYIAGAGEREQDALYQFGIHIGLAFQIQDDILDVWGDPATFGKAIGGDIACNKKTFVTLTALQLADEDSRHALHTWLSQTMQDNVEKIAAVTAIYDRLEVRAECEKRVVELTQQALSYLSTLPQNAAADQLRQLADKLNTRKS
jgi:geranylgeranyl diphosphate synthase type II